MSEYLLSMSELSKAYGDFLHKPLPYVFSLISFIFYTGITLFALLAVYMNAYIFLEKANLTNLALPIIGLLGIVQLYLTSGFYAAMLKGFYTATKSRARFDTEAFLTYAFNNAGKFFVAFIIVALINGIFAAPLSYVLTLNLSLAIKVVVGITLALLLFVINYLFYYLALTLILFEKINVFKAIKATLITSIKDIGLMLPYILFIITTLTLILPLIDLISLFVLYPITVAYSFLRLQRAERILARYL